MDTRFPFQVATWWLGMALGIPMLAAELACEVWRAPTPEPAPKPAAPASLGMTRTVEEIRTRFSIDGIEQLRDTMVAAQGAKLAVSPDPGTRAKGELMLAKVVAIRHVEVLGVRVPQRLRHCRAEPEDLGEDATQGDIAPAYVDALAAGQDCRRKLGAVDALLTAAEARVRQGAR